MHNLRSSMMSGVAPSSDSPLVVSKTRKLGPESDSLISVPVPRSEPRTANHRGEDRQRLIDEQITVRFNGEEIEAELINLSPGGAMIAAPIHPNLWDRVDLLFDSQSELETAVRWIRDERIGLEFAHETKLICAPNVHNELLGRVVQAHPDLLATEPETTPVDEAAEEEAGVAGDMAQRRDSARHPLVWSGQILFEHDAHPVRLRNISESGALIEATSDFPAGAEVFLDLGEGGTLFAHVSWSRGNQYGLRFRESFNLKRLALARPSVTPARAQEKPSYQITDPSAWAKPWGRMSMRQLKQSLGG